MQNNSSFTMWEKYRNQQEHLVIGIMSGTSLDGIDTALVRIRNNQAGHIEGITLVDFICVPYSDELRQIMIQLCAVEHARLDQLVQAHYGISEWYAYAVEQLLQSVQSKSIPIDRHEIECISMHGQTIWHAPEIHSFPSPVEKQSYAVRSTLQIGEPAVVRERTGIPVISNLRARDMAAGGEGAPLTPYCDGLMFGSASEGRIVQNIGGIGNATIIPAGATLEQISAFDTGPGNMIMDELIRIQSKGQQHYDANGEIAAQGKIHPEMLASYMSDPYYDRQPPKSTGREVYGADFANRFYSDGLAKGLSFADMVATATALTASSIVQALERWVLPQTSIARLLVCGGGASNPTLMKMIAERLPESIVLQTTADYGVPDDAREAMAFAVLGHESLLGRANNLPTVTGAEHAVILGNMTL